MDCSMPSLTISRSLPKLVFIASVMPSSHLILWCPLILPSIFPSIRDFSNESAVCIRWPKHWSCSFSISPFNEYSGDVTYGHLNKQTWTKHGSLKSSTCTARFPAVCFSRVYPYSGGGFMHLVLRSLRFSKLKHLGLILWNSPVFPW